MYAHLNSQLQHDVKFNMFSHKTVKNYIKICNAISILYLYCYTFFSRFRKELYALLFSVVHIKYLLYGIAIAIILNNVIRH